MAKTFSFGEFGFEVEIGKVAAQAQGAAWFRQGGTVVLSTVVSSPVKEFPGFLPLTVDYREQYSAAGKIPGGYFKREGRPTDREVLTSRLIDRAIRPLFPANYFDQIQLLSTVYSVDKEHAPNTIALLAASIAMSISPLPFLGPVGVVEMGRIDGEWMIYPSYQDMQRSDVRLVVAGTEEGINMVEGSMEELPEGELVDALFKAHDVIKRLAAWQKEIRRELGLDSVQEITDQEEWKVWQERVESFLTPERIKGTFIADKIERDKYIAGLQEAFAQEYAEVIKEEAVSSKVVDYLLDSVMKKKITAEIFAQGKRIDGRAYDQIRKITGEVGLLPFTHGSSLFNRGRTQALVSATLGGGQDEQRFDSLMSEEETGSFMLHYNFPPFSVGETFPMRGPGRREVGHGYLAASAIRPMLPDKEDFPYTIRVVADMLESDGSTSMATTCGATMALMCAGVPVKAIVGGIAMGLLRSDDGQIAVISDICGIEDAYGLMDFKVTGTKKGVTAIQMDIKYKGGFSREVFERALAQAMQGRLHIIGEMCKVICEPRPELSDLVPKVTTVKIDPDKIGAIIGGGGKTIKEITETTKTQIDIEQDGLVKIFGGPDSDTARAVRWVKTLGGLIEEGDTYEGKVRRIAEFGLFVELVPGLDGLVHISNIPREHKHTFAKEYKVDDVVVVRVLNYDPATGRVGLKLIEKK